MPMAMTIIGDIFPPHKRGKWQGVIGAVFGLSSIVGPTIGGWFVDHATWRWVFYINLPVGVLAAVTIFIGLSQELRRKEKVSIDFAGVVTLIVSIVSLLLGLSLGGKDYPWNSWEIIGLFITSVVFGIVFIFIEKKAQEPILSLHLFENRVFVGANVVGFLMGLGMNTDPQGLFNALLRPETLKMLPPQLQQVIISPLKIALADSLHLVYLVGMGIVSLGIFASLLLGNAKISKHPHKLTPQEAGMELLAEGVNGEITVPAEVEPDIIEDTDK